MLFTKCSKLANYGAKMIQVFGPISWNDIPENIRNSLSLTTFKQNLKMYFLNQYNSTPEQFHNHFYVSKVSADYMKITISKMKVFFVPPYLPNK